MGRFTLSDKALQDLGELWADIEARSADENAADRFIDGLIETFSMLADFPEMGSPREYLPQGVLALPHENFMTFYVKTPYGVSIAHVIYGGRDLVAFFDQSE